MEITSLEDGIRFFSVFSEATPLFGPALDLAAGLESEVGMLASVVMGGWSVVSISVGAG